MKVKDLMTENPATVNLNNSVKKVNVLMHKNNLQNLIVISDEGTVVGIVTYSDLFRQILPNYKELYEHEEYILNPKSIENRTDDIFNKKVSEIMTREPEITNPDVKAVEAGAKMIADKIKQLPVVKNGKLVGIISQYDITWGLLMNGCKYF